MKDTELIKEMNGTLRRALVLAIARYVKGRPPARVEAHKWLDADEHALFDLSTAELEKAAAEGLKALAKLEADARHDPAAWESVRVSAVHARLAFQSARSGSFASAAGALADFLRDAGAKPQTLDIH